VTVNAPQPPLPTSTRLARLAPNPFGERISIGFDIATSSLTSSRYSMRAGV
jgi:hypothetical protein